jgi:hypothetical protein
MTGTTHEAAKTVLKIASVKVDLRTDGYISTKFLAAGGKQYKELAQDFKNKGRISQVLDAVAAEVGLPTRVKSHDVSERGLIEVNTSTNKHFKGWLHPRAALVIAICWFKPAIVAEVVEWHYRFLSGDLTLVKDIVHNADAGRKTTTLVTMTTMKEGTEEVDVHAKCAASHVDEYSRKRKFDPSSAKEASCMYSTVEYDPSTRATIVTSEWLQRTINLDAMLEALVLDEPEGDFPRSLYFLREVGTNRVKVGFTNNLVQRLRTHQCGNAGDLAVEFELETPNYREVEASVKRHLTDSGLHIRGEWFFIRADCDYAAIVETASRLQ